MPPRSATKRSANSSEDGPSVNKHFQKKTRFVSPSEDPANFAEEVDAALETPVATRKGRVKTDGYDSDSSDDGEGVVPSRKGNTKTAAGEDDDDMFAMGDKNEKNEEEGKSKTEEFLRLGDIEGQEFNDAEDEEGSESEGEPEDEDDAERRKKAGMGFELTSFNMREEMEEGKFAADGTFVRSFDPHEMHDRWMEGLDERAIQKARRAKRAQEKVEQERIRKEEQEQRNMEDGKAHEVMVELIGLLKKGETVQEALSRLGAQAKKARQRVKSAKTSHMDVDQLQSSSDRIQNQMDRITTIASTLLAQGDVDIYSKTYEHLVREVRSTGNVEPTWEPPSADVKYEYKWDVPEIAGSHEVFGPFSEEDMKAWYSAQYFGAVGEKVKVRDVGGEWGDWDDIIQ